MDFYQIKIKNILKFDQYSNIKFEIFSCKINLQKKPNYVSYKKFGVDKVSI